MTRGVNQVEGIYLTFIFVLHLDGMTLNGNPALSLQVHIIQQLILHVAIGNRTGLLQQPVGQGALAVVDVCDNAEVPNSIHNL